MIFVLKSPFSIISIAKFVDDFKSEYFLVFTICFNPSKASLYSLHGVLELFFWEKQNFRKKIGLKTKKINYLESSGNIENTKQARHLANILLFVLIPSFLIPIAPSKPSPHPSL